MRFEFIADEHVKVKTFLKKHEVSKGLLAKIKFRGGAILVNNQPQNATYLLDVGDYVTIDIPAEKGFETLEAIELPLDILYEDDHFLVLNKPYGVASIPSVNHSNTIANFIKGYYVKQNYEIRVHFSHIGFPLLGDDLYGGSLEDGIQRQALHCHYLSFYHPFLEQDLQLESPLPDDFSNLITQLSTNTL